MEMAREHFIATCSKYEGKDIYTQHRKTMTIAQHSGMGLIRERVCLFCHDGWIIYDPRTNVAIAMNDLNEIIIRRLPYTCRQLADYLGMAPLKNNLFGFNLQSMWFMLLSLHQEHYRAESFVETEQKIILLNLQPILRDKMVHVFDFIATLGFEPDS